MVDVVGIGCCCIDFLGIIPRLPELDEEFDLLDSLQQGGGEVATALAAAARLGASAAYLGRVSDDLIGVMIRHDFERFGVDTSHLLIEPDERSLSAIVLVHKESGKRSILVGEATVSALSAEEVPPELIEDARILHLDGTEAEAAMAAAKRARQANTTVLLDADVSALGHDADELIGCTDIVVASTAFSHEHTGFEDAGPAVESLREKGPQTVIITQGEKGGVGLNVEGPFRFTAFQVDTVDTTGAGDVFHGGFIRGLLAGWPIDRIVEFAAAVAAIKCTKLGGRAGIPEMATVKAFLEERHDEFQFTRL